MNDISSDCRRPSRANDSIGYSSMLGIQGAHYLILLLNPFYKNMRIFNKYNAPKKSNQVSSNTITSNNYKTINNTRILIYLFISFLLFCLIINFSWGFFIFSIFIILIMMLVGVVVIRRNSLSHSNNYTDNSFIHARNFSRNSKALVFIERKNIINEQQSVKDIILIDNKHCPPSHIDKEKKVSIPKPLFSLSEEERIIIGDWCSKTKQIVAAIQIKDSTNEKESRINNPIFDYYEFQRFNEGTLYPIIIKDILVIYSKLGFPLLYESKERSILISTCGHFFDKGYDCEKLKNRNNFEALFRYIKFVNDFKNPHSETYLGISLFKKNKEEVIRYIRCLVEFTGIITTDEVKINIISNEINNY